MNRSRSLTRWSIAAAVLAGSLVLPAHHADARGGGGGHGGGGWGGGGGGWGGGGWHGGYGGGWGWRGGAWRMGRMGDGSGALAGALAGRAGMVGQDMPTTTRRRPIIHHQPPTPIKGATLLVTSPATTVLAERRRPTRLRHTVTANRLIQRPSIPTTAGRRTNQGLAPANRDGCARAEAGLLVRLPGVRQRL